MRRFLIHFLILTLFGSGLVYASEGQGEGEVSHSSIDTEFLMHTEFSQHDENDEHHAHHGCHFFVHMIGLICESTAFKPTGAQYVVTSFIQTYVSRFSAPLTKPPRV